MIRVDLQLPLETTPHQASLRRQGGGLSDTAQDPLVIGTLLIGVAALVFAVLINHQSSTRLAAVSTRVDTEVRDSARYAREIRDAEELRSKRSLIESRVTRISAIDANRYAFVHVLDQAAAALVPNVWLTSVTEHASDSTTGQLSFEITGFAPSNETLNAYVQQLEQSPFLSGIRVASASQTPMAQQQVLRFVLHGRSETPDPAFLMQQEIGPDGPRATGLMPPPDPNAGTTVSVPSAQDAGLTVGAVPPADTPPSSLSPSGGDSISRGTPPVLTRAPAPQAAARGTAASAGRPLQP